MNPQDNLLEGLRDIHGVPELPWWPPAPGWWLLAALLLAGLVWLARLGLKRYRAGQRRQRLLDFIDGIEAGIDPHGAPGPYLASLNRVFKIVALQAFPGAHCAQLAGQDWVGFVQDKLGGADAAPLAALADGPYRPAAEFDAGALTGLARQWVRLYG